MAIKLRTKRPDAVLKQIVEALKPYDAAHPRAKIEAYRWNSVSIRVRVIDPDFAGKDELDREEEVWGLLKDVPDEAVSEITLLLLFTPEEAKKSFANMDFDDHIPSRI
jgi:stress-induced morphogen